MRTLRWWICAAAGLLLAGAPAPAADPPPDDSKDVLALAAKIDEHIARHWAEAKVEPAPAADDAEFLRRVYLDLAGRIPSVSETRAFLEDKRPDKRQRLVNRLLDGPRYITHFTSVWRDLMLPEANASFQFAFLGPSFEGWLRKVLAKNAGYDEMARELMTAPVGAGGRGFNPNQPDSPQAFYIAKEFKPENIAATTSRLFLGVKLECAQCHNHPFASWKREQFWSYAAFFAGISGQRQGDFVGPGREVTDRTELTIPGLDKVVQAKFLDGKEPVWKPKTPPRVTLADWMTAPDNPYFAKAAVNRMWYFCFGVGLVDPVDEMVGAQNTSSHPELLDEMARQFVAHKFDLKFLIRAITASRAYQLSSARTNDGQDEPQLFAKMAVKGMTAEQLFDSLAEATGYREGGRQNGRFFDPFNDGSARAEFRGKFSNKSDKPTEMQTSILQALTLMNGRVIADTTSIERSETLAAIADAPFLTTEQKIETLFLAALARKPTPKELNRFVRYVESGGAGDAPADRERATNQALADVFWVLLNSSEFILNH
jgi:hypothetical protein